MKRLTEPILRLGASVVGDVLGYRAKVKKFLDGQTSPVSFRAYRVSMGIYEQRTVEATLFAMSLAVLVPASVPKRTLM